MKKFSTYQKRRKLYEMLPLETPLSVHVCPSTYCNFKCHYCVHSVSNESFLENGIKKQFMDMKVFETLIEQLKGFQQKLKLLNFAYLGEPLLNEHIGEMVKMAKEADVAERVEIVTNASMLTRDLSRKLVDAGLNRLRISIQGISEKEYFDISRYRIQYEKLLDEIRYIYEISRNTDTKIYIKTVDAVLDTEEKKDQFAEMFGGICDNLNIESLIPITDKCDISDLKTEFNTGYFGNGVQETAICSEVFYTMVVLPDGGVIPCCTMGKAPVQFENICKKSITDIWNSEELNGLRKKMLTCGYKSFETCKGCGVPLYQTSKEDYLDQFAEELLKKY